MYIFCFCCKTCLTVRAGKCNQVSKIGVECMGFCKMAPRQDNMQCGGSKIVIWLIFWTTCAPWHSSMVCA